MELLRTACKTASPTNLIRNKASFHVIGNDKMNPWEADSYMFTPMQIRELSREYQIFATPHIGLHWPSNSMYAHMGVGICDFTSNQSVRDTADLPEYIGLSGNTKHCALEHGQVLSPYLKINTNLLCHGGLPEAIQEYAGCNNLAYIHHDVKKKTIGNPNVIIDVDILESDFVPRALEVLLENETSVLDRYQHFATKLFNRFVNEKGIVSDMHRSSRDVISSFLKLKQSHKRMILHDEVLNPSGYIPIKEVMIILDAIRCYRSHTGKKNGIIGNSFITSGVSMIHYLKNPRTRMVLQNMYEVLQKEFDWLPLHMRMFVLPGGVFRFLPSSGEPELEQSVLNLLS